MRETDAEHQRQLAFRKRVMAGGERIVSQKGFGSPELLASDIVEQLLAHVTTSDLIVSVRPDLITAAASAGVGQRAIIELAQRINAEVSDFDQALVELERAVKVAVEVVEQGERGTNLGDFVDAALARIAEKSALGEYDLAAAEANKAFARWERNEAERRETELQAGIALLDAGLKQDIPRRDAGSAARRVERLVALCSIPTIQSALRRCGHNRTNGMFAAAIEASISTSRLRLKSRD